MAELRLIATPVSHQTRPRPASRIGLTMELGGQRRSGPRKSLFIGPANPGAKNGESPRAPSCHRPGEVAIHCANPALMAGFYEHVIGLEPLPDNTGQGRIRLRIPGNIAGHASILILLGDSRNHGQGVMPGRWHLALFLPYEEQEAVMDWYAHLEKPYRVEHFHRIGRRRVFTEDPEGNMVELMAFAPASGYRA